MKTKQSNSRFEKMLKLSVQDYPTGGKKQVQDSSSGYISKKTRLRKTVNTLG